MRRSVINSLLVLLLPDRVTKVLGGDAHGGPGHAEQGGGAVVELEHPVVDVDLVELEPAGEIVHKMSHAAGVECLVLGSNKSITTIRFTPVSIH